MDSSKYHWATAKAFSLYCSIFTKVLFWKHQDLTQKERYTLKLLWTDLVGSLCQRLDISSHTHRDWENIVTQMPNTYRSKGLVESVPSPVQILTHTQERGGIMFLKAGPCSLTGAVTGPCLNEQEFVMYICMYIWGSDRTCAKLCWYRASPVCPMFHV